MKTIHARYLAAGLLFQLVMQSPGSLKAIDFIENKGQWNPAAIYKADFSGGQVFLLKDGFLFTLYDTKKLHEFHDNGVQQHLHDKIKCHSYKLTFTNASDAVITGMGESGSYRNYFLGTEMKNWKGHVKSYDYVTYTNIFPGIDLKVYSSGNRFKYDFILHPGARLSDISMKLDGLDSISGQGESLNMFTAFGKLTENIPMAFFESGNKKEMVPCFYRVNGNQLSFDIPGLDKNSRKARLIIDPVLLLSTYSGSSGTTYGSSATYDAQGNLFIGALLFDTGWPYTLGAYDITYGGGIDMGITKFDQTGSNQLWSTYLGGMYEDIVLSMMANNNDELFVFGYTYQNYPVTPGAYDVSSNGQNDMVVSKLSSNGSQLLASTYVGGNDDDGRSLYLSMNVHSYGDLDKGELQLDAAGNPVVASMTRSVNFPVTPGAFQVTHGGNIDGCVFKLNSTLTSLVYSTFLGGAEDEACYGMVLDAAGNPVMTGGTNSNNFPVSPGAYQPSYGGGFSYQFDSFVSVLDATGSSLVASTYFGFSNSKDKGYKTALDTAGNIYAFGNSEGTLPVSPGVYSTQNTGNYVIKFNPALTNLLKCTAYGDGTAYPNLQPIAFHVDGCNQVYCAGFTSSTFGNPGLFPVTPNAQQPAPSGTQDLHVTVLAADFASLLYGSYLGGAVREHTDAGSSRFDRNAILYAGVCTEESFSGGFPVLPNAFSPSSQTPDWDMAGVKWDFAGCPTGGISAAPQIGLASSDTSWCDKKAIDFFDLSTNNPTSWQWTFQGATPNTSTQQHPAGIYYPAYGSFDVQLIACNAAGCDTLLLPGFITEFQLPPAPVITSSHDTLYCTPAYSYQWYDLNGPVPGATGNFFVPPAPQTYFVIITDSMGCSSPSGYVVVAGMHDLTGISRLTLFPNPSGGLVTLDFEQASSGVLTILAQDVTGRTIQNLFSGYAYPGSFRKLIDMRDISPGMYMIRINLDGAIRYIRIIRN